MTQLTDGLVVNRGVIAEPYPSMRAGGAVVDDLINLGYRDLCRAEASGGHARWVGRTVGNGEPRLAYYLEPRAIPMGAGEARGRLEAAARFVHRHAVAIEAISSSAAGGLWIVSEYPGGPEGLLSLPKLLAMKPSGQASCGEARNAACQLLGLARDAHGRGLAHGAVASENIFVDRRGTLRLELYGVELALISGPSGQAVAERAEIRSIVAIVHELITGVAPGTPRIPAAKLVRGLPSAWVRWLDHGLDERCGFESASSALASLPN